MSIKEIDSIIKLTKQKSPCPDRINGEFYQKFKKDIIIPIPYNINQRIEASF